MQSWHLLSGSPDRSLPELRGTLSQSPEWDQRAGMTPSLSRQVWFPHQVRVFSRTCLSLDREALLQPDPFVSHTAAAWVKRALCAFHTHPLHSS